MGVFHGYFDDSGTHTSSPVVTMAGYLSLAGDWKPFEAKSRKLFKRERIQAFHAVDFFQKQGEFKNWEPARQLSFAMDWYEIAADHIKHGITISVDKDRFKNVKSEHKRLPTTSDYGYCLHIIMKRLCADENIWEFIKNNGLSIIIGASRPKRYAGIKSVFHDIARENNLEKYFESLTSAKKTSSIALQLSDYLAYFSWQLANKAALGTLNERSIFHDIAIKNVFTDGALAEDFRPNPFYHHARP